MIKVIGDRILLKKEDPESKTKGGIIIPQAARERRNIGEVVSFGDNITVELKPGDLVCYETPFATPPSIILNDIEYDMIKSSDIVAIETKKATKTKNA
jgi:chaperonin GroES